MAERRTRHHDSPRRRKGESNSRTITNQDEVPRSRALPYQPTETPISYLSSSSSSSYIDISRTFPSSRVRGLGLGAIRAFFTSPSEHRRRPRRRTSRPYLRTGTSSSSSVNTDLAYGTGYVRRRKGGGRGEKGKERRSGDRRDLRAERDPDAAILEVGAGLAALARKQNRLDLAESRKQGIPPSKRNDSGTAYGATLSRGLGSSKISQGPDDEGWESATDADSETSSVDSRLAYRHDNAPGWGGFFRSRPKRKDSVVDPALFGPANSLHGIIREPVGFDDVDHDNLSDYPPPTVADLQKGKGYPPPVSAPPRESTITRGDASATGPLQYVYPIPTADPTRFEAVRASSISTQDPYDPRSASFPILPASVEIQQPRPQSIVSQSVFDPSYSTRSESNFPLSSGRTKSSVAGAALAGVAGSVIGAAANSARRDDRNDRDRREGEPRERPVNKEGADDRREKRRERDRDRPEESREERRERRRREKRDDPDYERREKRREKRRDDDVPNERVEIRREDKGSARPDDRNDQRRTLKDAPIVPANYPFQYQVADDAFTTPDDTRSSDPFVSIQRARSPAVVTVDRVPHWHREPPAKEETVKSSDDFEKEKDRDARETRQTEKEAEPLYKENEHPTVPSEASAGRGDIAAEEYRPSREKVRKRRYDRSGDASPTGERDPIQEEADRIYREAVLAARKVAQSKTDDPVIRIVTPPEMANNKDKEILYPVPNADFELDHVMDPVEFMTSPVKRPGEGFSQKSLPGLGLEDLKRPLMTLVRPTPTPSPNPEEQHSRSKRKDSSRETDPSTSKSVESGSKESSQDMERSVQEETKSERKGSSQEPEPSETREKPGTDAVVTEIRGERSQTPTSANGTKGVTWGENDTKHYEVESPYETKDDPIAASMNASDNQEKPKMSKERKASAWGALKGAFMSGAAADFVAKATEVSTDDKGSKTDRREKDAGPANKERGEKPTKKERSRSEPFEYRGAIIEPEHSDVEIGERAPPVVGPKPSMMSGSNMPGAFDDDLDFTATLAAGLQDSGFDPNIVIKDPTYRRRSSPPGSDGPPLAEYKQPHAETAPDLSQYANPVSERSRDVKAQDSSLTNDRTDKEQKKLDKAAKRQSRETRDLDLSEKTPVTTQLVEEPDSFLESSKLSKKDKKRDKTKKSKDSYDDANDPSSKRVSVPVDAFDDLRAEAFQVEAPDEWDTPKKSKKKSKRDSGQYDPPSRSMSASDITSSVELSKKKSKDRSSKRSSQYDSEPNPEDIPLPSASEISRDDEHDSRKSKRSSKRSSSIPDVADRDNRSVKSDSSRYADEDDSRSSKKEKKSSGFFSGIFGSSTSKPEPERPKDSDYSESKKKSRKSKRSSVGDSSEIYGSDAQSDVKSSLNGNGYENYDGDEGSQKKSVNGDGKHGKTDEKEESFLGNAGTLGAGVGLAAAIALVAQHQQSIAATAEIEERAPQRLASENASPARAPSVEATREVFEEDTLDPDIVERQFRPSIDPQYGDLLPLPPSDPGSPNVEGHDTLPSLPESRPDTPPRPESVNRGRSVGSSRRSELPALVKTPSQSAVPIKFIMGNRSTPSSPGLVRAPSMSSPSAMSPETLGFHRSRQRPTSWDSTKEIQPLYLLDPNRRAPASQSTDSGVQSPVGEDGEKPAQIDNLILEPGVMQETKSTDAGDYEEAPEAEHSKEIVREDLNQDIVSGVEFPDHKTLPPLPISRDSTPMGRVERELDLSSLPPLPNSGTSTPADALDVSGLPQGEFSTLSEGRSLQDPGLATAGLLTGAALGLSAGALALGSSLDEAFNDKESVSKSTATEELPVEFQVEPITKDRSSYLFQATPPAKRTKGVDVESPLDSRQSQAKISSQIEEEVLIQSADDGSTAHLVTYEREATLEALTGSMPDEEEPLESVASTQPVTARESEVEAVDEFAFTKSKKNKKKNKKRMADQFGLNDEPSSSTIIPPSVAEPAKNTEGPPEFSLKKSKKNKKKDKKRTSSQWDAENEPSESAITAQANEVDGQERDIVDTPSTLFSADIPLSSEEQAPEEAQTVEEFSVKKSKKDKKDKKRASGLNELKDEGSERTVLSPKIASSLEPADPIVQIAEPLETFPTAALLSSVEPASDLFAVDQRSLEKSEKGEEQNQEKALEFNDSRDEASASAAALPSVTSVKEEVEKVNEFAPPLSETVMPSSVEPASASDVPVLKASKKDKKANESKDLDLTEDGDDKSQIIAPPSSFSSVAQEADPSDELSFTPSKNDKKKEKKNSKNLSRSSTLVEPSADDPLEKFDDFSIAEQTPLPVSRASSEVEASAEVAEEDLKSKDLLPGQDGNLESVVPATEPVTAKDSKKSKKKGRKSMIPLDLDESITEVPLGREVDNIGVESKNITDVQDEPQLEPQVETVSITESKKDKKDRKRRGKSVPDWESEEPPVSGPVEEEPTREQLENDGLLKDELSRDPPITLEPVQKDIIEAELAPELSLQDQPVQPEKVQDNVAHEFSTPDEPTRDLLPTSHVNIENDRMTDITPTEDVDQSKLVGPDSESSNIKSAKKSKKKKGKFFQDGEAPESQLAVTDVSEPTSVGPSEREDLSGFSKPKPKSKGKKNQNRKSIARDLPEPESGPALVAAQSVTATDVLICDTPIEADLGKEIADLPHHELGNPLPTLDEHKIKELDAIQEIDAIQKLDPIQEPEKNKEAFTSEPEVAMKVIEDSTSYTGPSVLSTMPTADESFGTARGEFSGVEYFPSAVALHSPRVPEDIGESHKNGYFPSAARLLPAAAPIVVMTTSILTPQVDAIEHPRPHPEDVILSTTTAHETLAEPLRTFNKDAKHEHTPVDEPPNESRELPAADNKYLPSIGMSSFSDPLATSDLPKQTHMEYFPSAAFLHSPVSAGSRGDKIGGGYFPSATILLPLVGSAAFLTNERDHEQEDLMRDVHDDKEPPIAQIQGYDEQVGREAAETIVFAPEKDISEPIPQVLEQGTDRNSSPPYSEEQLEAARQLNADFGSGKKKSKGKKGRADTSPASIQDDEFQTEVANEPEELQQNVETDREFQVVNDLAPADGLAAGYREDQVALAKQLQAEHESGSKKPKKGKKSRSTSRALKEYDASPSFSEEPNIGHVQPAKEVSREIIAGSEDAPINPGPDGIAAGFTEEQLEVARHMREEFASGPQKSKKDKKRKGLVRSTTDENISGPAEGGTEETSLATTEVDSATDSPYPMSIAPTPEDFESSFTTKKGKKEKKRQSLLRSFTQDSEDSAGPTHGITAEPEPIKSLTPENDNAKAVDTAAEIVTGPQDNASSAVADEYEALSFSMKKGKKGNKKRQSIVRSATQEGPSSDPTSGVAEPKQMKKEITEAATNQPPDVIGDSHIDAQEEELNFTLKKSKKDKKNKKGKGKETDSPLVEAENISQRGEQKSQPERNITQGKDHDQESLADRIWADAVPIPTESNRPETEIPSAESEDPLGLYTAKKSKKNKKKGQVKSTAASEIDSPLKDTVSTRLESKQPSDSWADEVGQAEDGEKQPKLFDTWSFRNLQVDELARETSANESKTVSEEVEDTHHIKQNETADISLASPQPEKGRPDEPPVQVQQTSATDVQPVEELGTPPPVMPRALAWEDEPALEQNPEVRAISATDFSAPDPVNHNQFNAKDKAKHGAAKPVSAGILMAGAALLLGSSTGHDKKSSEVEPLSISRSAADDKEASTSRSTKSEKKKEKRPAKLLDRRSIAEDDLFDNPILWEGAETQKFSEQVIKGHEGDDGGFWSAAAEREESPTNDFAVEDAEEDPSLMSHKRERSESLMEVWDSSTVLDHIKTPRKHQYEDVPTAIARDAIMEQEIAEEQPKKADSLSQDTPKDDLERIEKPNLISQGKDIPGDFMTQSSKKAKKDKKQSQRAPWDSPGRGEVEVGSSYTTVIEPAALKDVIVAPTNDQRTSIVREANEDLEHEKYRDLKLAPLSSSAITFAGEEQSPTQRNMDEAREHTESTKHRHRSEETYIPPLSSLPRDTEDESDQQRDLDLAHSELPSERRVKDKLRHQELYFPPPSTLPVVIEEDDHKPETEHVVRDRSIDDNNRDSAFVAESPVPFQGTVVGDHEYARDSGVHLRDWGDTPMTKNRSHVVSTDDALARLSWPAVDEETETVDLKRSQRAKDERSPKGHAASAALGIAGVVAVTELAHLAGRSPPQKRDERAENAKFDRSITPNMSRLQTPDHAKFRPVSVGSNRSSGTPPLRRSDRKFSGDLRSLSQRSQANLAKEAKDGKEVEHSPATSTININPTANEGRPRVKDMADVYDGYGEGRIGSPMSPTRPHSMRRRQSMQVLDLESRVEQLAAENRILAEAKELAEHSLQSSQRAALALADRDAEVDSLKQTLDWLHREVERLKEVNDGLTSANITIGRQHNERYGALESQHADAARELEDLRQSHRGLSGGVEDVVMEQVAAATQEKDQEIAQLRQDLEAAQVRIREMQREILRAKDSNNEFLVFRDEDYFDSACQQLCKHVQQWVLRFSKFSDMRACRRTNEINNDKIIDRLDNAVLDGSDVDEYLSDRVKRRDIFMSMTMTMIWEFVFTRYLFGMDREQRQKLKSLEKTLLEVGPPAAVHQWRATTLTLLSKRFAFQQQREKDTIAVVQMIIQTLSEILPPPSHLEEQIQEQLMRVMKAAVDLSIEMRTQRAEYMMLPPLQPVYDANGDLESQVQFNAALMNEHSGDTVSNEELEAQHAVVRIVLFPLVVKKGNDSGGGDEEIVVCPAQVQVANPRRHARGLTPEVMGQNANHSRVSMQSSMPVEQHVPDF